MKPLRIIGRLFGSFALTFLFFAVAIGQQDFLAATPEIGDDGFAFQPFETLDSPNQHTGFVSEVQYLEVKQEVLDQIIAERHATLVVEIPNGRTVLQLDLNRVDLFANNYQLSTSSGETYPENEQQAFYQGNVKGRPNSRCAVSFFPNEVRVLFADEDGNHRVTRLDGGTRYAFYHEENWLRPLDGVCAVQEEGSGSSIPPPPVIPESEASFFGDCLDVFFECDFKTYQDNGSSVSATEQFVTGTFNEMQILFEQAGIPLNISEILVWNSPDPYTDTPNTLTGFFQFLSNFADVRQDNYNGRLAQLLTTRTIHPLYYGLAIFGDDVVCRTYSTDGTWANGPYSMGTRLEPNPAPFPNYSNNLHVMAHELAHNLGAEHTHSCVWNGNDTQIDDCASVYFEQNPNPDYTFPDCYNSSSPILPTNGGTLMSYCQRMTGIGVNFSLGFHPQVRSVILNNYNSANCLTGEDCAPSAFCNINDPFCLEWLPDVLNQFQDACDSTDPNQEVTYDVYTATANGQDYIYANQFVTIAGFPFVDIDVVYDCDGVIVDACIENLNNGSVDCSSGPAMGAIVNALQDQVLIWSCDDPIPPCVGCDLNISINSNDPSCGSNNGSILINASGGTPSYEYSIGGAFASNNFFGNLPAGTYFVTVRDAVDCEETTTVVLIDGGNDLSLSITPFSTLCSENTGFIDLQVSGGTPTYSYNWQPNLGNIQDPSGLAAGFYSVTVTDANGCTASISTQITVEACPPDDNPVCGVDGNEYANPCEAMCAGVGYTFGPCDDGPCICPADYNPVCGSDGITYPNACSAECAGITEYEPGECFADCICPLNYDPVCGSDGFTYPNACAAECAGVDWVPGECEALCVCPHVYDPVCGSDGITYSNACVAECAGVDWEPGPCDSPCVCEAIYDPVCGSDGNTYSNSCYAECAGITEYTSGVCSEPCICEALYDPVCGVDGITYSNACYAACAGVEVASDGACTDECNCPALYDPVCGSDGITYYNSCVAECANVDWTPGVCEQVCDCPAIYDPVCGSDGLTYQNACYAECAGVNWTPGICEELCICPALYDPVCGSDGNTYSNGCYAECAGIFDYTSGACFPPVDNVLCLPWLRDIVDDFGVCGSDEAGGECGQTISLGSYQGEVFVVVYDYCSYPFNNSYTETAYNLDGVAVDQCSGAVLGFTCDFFPPQGAILDGFTNTELIWSCGDDLPDCYCDLAISVSTTLPDCGGDNGQVSISIQSGAPPFVYQLGEQVNSTGLFTNLTEGVYNLSVTDDKGCVVESYAVLFSEGYPDCLSGEITIISDLDDCSDFVYQVSGTFASSCTGFSGINYSRQGNVFTANVQTFINFPPCTSPGSDWSGTAVDTPLASGIYTIELLINGQFVTSITFTIEECSTTCDLNVVVVGTDPDCGLNNGSVSAIPDGGTPPYSYDFGNGFQDFSTLSGLAAGIYSVTVMDAEGCTAENSVILDCDPVISPMFYVAPTTITRDIGNTLILTVAVNDLVDVTSIQFPMTWDSDLMTFQSISIINDLPGLSSSNFITPLTGGPAGQLSFSWFDPTGDGVSLDDAGLFSVTFLAVAEGTTAFAFREDLPLAAEISGAGGTSLDFNAANGQVTIIDPNTGGGQTTFILGDEEVNQGENFCLPITVTDFNNLLGMQFSVNYDASILSYTGAQNFTTQLVGFGAGNVGNPSPGNLTFTWTDPLLTGASMADNSTVVELCFTATGTTTTQVVFSGTPTPIELIDADEEQVAFLQQDGTVTIIVPEPGTFGLAISAANACEGETFCLDVTASSFTNISAFSFPVLFDPSALSLNGIINVTPNLPGFSNASFTTPAGGEVAVNWMAAGVAEALDPQENLFTICFEKLTNTTTAVNIQSSPNTQAAVVDGNDDNLPFTDLSTTITSDDCTTGDEDQDGDGYSSAVDCDDTNPEINPGAEEIPGNNVDENCDDIIGTLPTDLLTFIGGDAAGGEGDTVMIPVTVENFNNISGFQFTMVIPEPDQGTFVEFVPSPALTGVSVNPANGIFRVIWNIALGAPPLDLSDDTIIFWVKVRLNGEPGDCSVFSFSNIPTAISAVEGLDNSFVPATMSGTFCVRATVNISGTLLTEYNLPVSNAEVGNPDGQVFTTATDGVYTFTELPADQDYVIEPHRDIEHSAGVTVGDIVLIRAHIIGFQDLNSPYKIIAADATGDDIVTVLDLITLQRLVIGFLDTFPNNESWRFVPSDYDFLNPLAPLEEDFPEALRFTNLTTDITDGDFVGIKVGDVNEDVILAIQGGSPVALQTIDQKYAVGELLNIPLSFADGQTPAGWQFAFHLPAEEFELLEVIGPDGGPLSTDQYHRDKHLLRVIWYDDDPAKARQATVESPLQLRVKALRQGQLSKTLELATKGNRIANVHGREAVVNDLIFLPAEVVFEPLQVSTCYPLPFREKCTLTLTSTRKESATLKILSPGGALIWQSSREVLPGVQSWEVPSERLPGAGLYFFQLQTPTSTHTGKLIHNR